MAKPQAEETQLAPRAASTLAQAPAEGELSIGAIIRFAVEKGMEPESLEKLVALHERIEDRAAAKEFAAAMAAFQSECPPIPKTATAKIPTKSGGSYSYRFAPLEKMAPFIRPYLERHGLSYTWDSSEEGNKVTCTCTARHINGHSVSASFTCSNTTAAAMSDAQKSGAALTYARRQSLAQVFGLTMCDPEDTDGGGVEKISEHQAANLAAMIQEVGADYSKFLEYLGIEALEDLPLADFDSAIRALEEKRRRGSSK